MSTSSKKNTAAYKPWVSAAEARRIAAAQPIVSRERFQAHLARLDKTADLRFAKLAPEVWKKLGEIPRTGWVNRGVENPETVQEHTVSVRSLGFVVAFQLPEFSETDLRDLEDMLEVHDWPEHATGDEVILTTNPEERKKLRGAKLAREREAMGALAKSLGQDGFRVLNLWLRFESSEDPVASFARQMDKYQAIEKAAEFEREQGIPLLDEFRNHAARDIVHPALVQRLISLRVR